MVAKDASGDGELQPPDGAAAGHRQLSGAHAASREQHRRGTDPVE